MYQLIVIIFQSCFAYPKGKQLTKREINQLTTRTKVITKSIDCDAGEGNGDDGISNKKMTMKSWRRIIEGDHCPKVSSSPSNNDNSENESYQLNDKDDDGTIDRSSTCDLLASDSILTSCPSIPKAPQPVPTPPVTCELVVQKNVNITVSYNPPTSFDQLRSARPNCFISSISRGGAGLSHYPSCTFIPTPSPGSTVKTTEIKSPEEVAGVKSPSPEAWKVAIDTANGINWTQAKPITTTTITSNNISTTKDHNNNNNRSKNRRNSNNNNNNKMVNQVCWIDKNAIQSPDQSNQQQSTNQFPITNQQFDGSESIQIVTKETIL